MEWVPEHWDRRVLLEDLAVGKIATHIDSSWYPNLQSDPKVRLRPKHFQPCAWDLLEIRKETIMSQRSQEVFKYPIWILLRAAITAPAEAPLMMEFQGSSFCRRWAKVQSKDAKQMPQAANCPPKTGARSFMRISPPIALRENPVGAWRAPLIMLKIDPPIKPMVKAPPQSSMIRQGLEQSRNRRGQLYRRMKEAR